MIEEQIGLSNINEGEIFSKQDYYQLLLQKGYKKNVNSFLVYFQKLINDKLVQRVGRNAYIVTDKTKSTYDCFNSDYANKLVKFFHNNYPYMDFVIFETIQLNEFLNHLLGMNTIFVFVDNDVIGFAFDILKNKYSSNVMLAPDKKQFHLYAKDNSIIITRLVSEAPRNIEKLCQETIEKMLVDIVAEPLIREILSESEYTNIYERAFERYIIDESKMFRYARRRNADEKIKELLLKTSVSLKLEKNDK